MCLLFCGFIFHDDYLRSSSVIETYALNAYRRHLIGGYSLLDMSNSYQSVHGLFTFTLDQHAFMTTVCTWHFKLVFINYLVACRTEVTPGRNIQFEVVFLLVVCVSRSKGKKCRDILFSQYKMQTADRVNQRSYDQLVNTKDLL